MSIITCPNCRSPLTPCEGSYCCTQGHAFDIAKEGYVNLLLPNKKKTLNPGDNKRMLRAREDFLSTGTFQFLIDEMDAQLQRMIPHPEGVHVLDIGSGSGYYLRHILSEVACQKIGLDISKNGMAMAAKRDKKSTYLVASAYDLPIAADSIDLVLNIFSPIDLDELSRVLKSGGFYLKVIPGSNHMREVAELIYEKFIPHQSEIEFKLSELQEFSSLEIVDLEKKVTLNREELTSLISMTPYLYKFSDEQMKCLTGLRTTLSFQILIYRYSDVTGRMETKKE